VFNEGKPTATVTNGFVEISAAANDAVIDGRLLTALGAAVSNARVLLTITRAASARFSPTVLVLTGWAVCWLARPIS